MIETARRYLIDFLRDVVTLDDQIVLLVLLVIICLIVLDALLHFTQQLRGKSGVTHKTQVKALDGSSSIPEKSYFSDIQGLMGKPDAILRENGFFIPVERKPLSRKLRDRHVAQLLVYMRLIEEFEGKRPPYGYLILGENARKVKIPNSEGRQRWLQGKLDEMRKILEGEAQAIPSPLIPKCRACPVRAHCSHSVAPTSDS